MFNKLNLSGFTNLSNPQPTIEVQKAYQEGVYSDTPANKKLGRVGMTYKQYENFKSSTNKKEEKVQDYKIGDEVEILYSDSKINNGKEQRIKGVVLDHFGDSMFIGGLDKDLKYFDKEYHDRHKGIYNYNDSSSELRMDSFEVSNEKSNSTPYISIKNIQKLPSNKEPEQSFPVKWISKEEQHRFTDGQTSKPFAGNFGIKDHNHNYTIYALDSYDKDWLESKGVKAGKGETIYRYQTEATRASKMSPLVKVNTYSGLVYFNEGDSDNEEVKFGTKGSKAVYMNLMKPEDIKKEEVKKESKIEPVEGASFIDKNKEYSYRELNELLIDNGYTLTKSGGYDTAQNETYSATKNIKGTLNHVAGKAIEFKGTYSGDSKKIKFDKLYQKEEPKKETKGTVIGTTKSGKSIYNKFLNNKDFTYKDYQDAAELNNELAKVEKDEKMKKKYREDSAFYNSMAAVKDKNTVDKFDNWFGNKNK